MQEALSMFSLVSSSSSSPLPPSSRFSSSSGGDDDLMWGTEEWEKPTPEREALHHTFTTPLLLLQPADDPLHSVRRHFIVKCLTIYMQGILCTVIVFYQ